MPKRGWRLFHGSNIEVSLVVSQTVEYGDNVRQVIAVVLPHDFRQPGGQSTCPIADSQYRCFLIGARIF